MYSVGQEITPDQAMRLAIEVAKTGQGFVSPNPLVGCVIVDKNHKFLSSGAHLRFGGPHAEINALRNIKDNTDLIGASVYVTLEPCSHVGNTGSCASALAQLPIKKVYYGLKDPNPLVAGRGIAILSKHAKEVSPFGKYQQECQQVCEQFLYHIEHGRPFISLKVGMSLDGKIALKSGESQWITGEEARKYSRALRAHYDATMIGSGTLQYDDPTLDFRDTSFENEKENKIIILDPKGNGADFFKSSKLKAKHDPKNIFVLTRAEYVEKWSKNLVHVLEWDASKVTWEQTLKNLYARGIFSIFVEGGAYVFGQVLQYDLAQKIYLFQSPKILGEGISWSHYYNLTSLSKAHTLKNWQSLPIGEDYLHSLYW